MHDDFDQFTKAAMARGVTPANVTAETWLDTWTEYGQARIGQFKALAGAFTDVLQAIRNRLRDLVSREAPAKAAIAADEELLRAAWRTGDRDLIDRVGGLVAREKAMLGSLDSDARRLRRSARSIGMYDIEGEDR